MAMVLKDEGKTFRDRKENMPPKMAKMMKKGKGKKMSKMAKGDTDNDGDCK